MTFLFPRLSGSPLTAVTCYYVRSSRPGRPPKRASGVGLSLAATQFPGHPFKKHRLENGEYSPYENGHMSGKYSLNSVSRRCYFSLMNFSKLHWLLAMCSGFINRIQCLYLKFYQMIHNLRTSQLPPLLVFWF